MPLMLVRVRPEKTAMANPFKKKGLKKILARGRFKKKEAITFATTKRKDVKNLPEKYKKFVKKHATQFGEMGDAVVKKHPNLVRDALAARKGK